MGEPQGHQNFCVRILNNLLCTSNDPHAPKKTWGRKCLECMKPTDEESNAHNQDDGPARETWGNRCTFFISTLGMSVGLGQVWRFPTLAYSKGGGAFLIIYGIMIFFFGNSLFFFEVSNGQYASKNPLLVFDKVPLFQGVGWSMIMYAYLFCTYYSHMVSFSLYYLAKSFTAHLPWTFCPNNLDDHPDKLTCMPYPRLRDPILDGVVCGLDGMLYNRTELCRDPDFANATRTTCCAKAEIKNPDDCLSAFNVTKLCQEREYPSEYYWSHTVNRKYREGDPMFGYLGPFNYWLTTCSFISWFLAYVTLYKGIKSMGVLMYIMVPLPYIVLVIMFGVVIPQEGATYGLEKFFVPDFTSLYDVTVWRTATEQAFYSIGVAMGPLITFGSYAPFKSPTHIDGILICLCIFLTSVLCSLVVFSVLGFLSVKTGRPFEKVVEAGPGLVFIVYPESLELLPAAQFFCVLFYLMLINLGMSSITGIIETVSSAVYDIWPGTRRYKYIVNFAVLASCFLIGLPITCRGGLNVYDAFDIYSAGMTLIPICACELIIIVYIYGLGRFCEDIAFMIGFYPNRYYRYQWMAGPFILMAVFIYGLITLHIPDQRLWAEILGWFLFMCVMGMIPIGMIYQLIVYGKKHNLKQILKPVPDHGPKRESDRREREGFTTKRKIF
ncbi:hypothetical protein RUM44_010909 [Polyplax serrata]|uniref:Uncharacterized protein n=1 Tax=Polyplax serrata TaxID=468196 RepID=A0ABR1ANK6_POLSC